MDFLGFIKSKNANSYMEPQKQEINNSYLIYHMTYKLHKKFLTKKVHKIIIIITITIKMQANNILKEYIEAYSIIYM